MQRKSETSLTYERSSYASAGAVVLSKSFIVAEKSTSHIDMIKIEDNVPGVVGKRADLVRSSGAERQEFKPSSETHMQ